MPFRTVGDHARMLGVKWKQTLVMPGHDDRAVVMPGLDPGIHLPS